MKVRIAEGFGFDVVFSAAGMLRLDEIAQAKLLQNRLLGLPMLVASRCWHELAGEFLEGFELLHIPHSDNGCGCIYSQRVPRRLSDSVG